jgi:hypothetical protein
MQQGIVGTELDVLSTVPNIIEQSANVHKANLFHVITFGANRD